MTNERAVEILNLDLDILGQYGGESAEAYKMAIKALDAQPCEDCIRRQAVIILIDEASEMHPYKVVGDSDTYSNYNQGWSDACDWLYANIEGVPSVTPRASEEDIHREREQAYMLGYEDASKKFRTQPSEDAVSRSELMKLYKEWQPRLATNVCEFEQALEDLPSVTPRINLAETSQDCISREEVQDLISRWLSDYLLDETREALETINYKVGDMPSVIPQRKMGKWIDGYCSECGESCLCDGWGIDYESKYCPNCGAEMSGGEEDG